MKRRIVWSAIAFLTFLIVRLGTVHILDITFTGKDIAVGITYTIGILTGMLVESEVRKL